jgi:peptide/nickel transport system substrate-binding protein
MSESYWERFRRTRISRRAALKAGAVTGAGVAAAAVIGCGGGGDGGGGQATAGESVPGAAPIPSLGNPRPGGIYLNIDNVVATHRSPYHAGNEASQVRPMFQTYYDVLWSKRAAGDNPLIMEFAESYEQVSPTQVTVKLKRGVTFHNRAPVNGREVTAEDVVKDIEFIRDTANRANLNSAFIRNDLTGPPTQIDNYTVRFETKGPRAYFFDTDQVAVSIVPKEMLNESTLREQPQVGSGPYEFKDERQGSTYEQKRFEGYRVKGKPYLDGVKLTIVPDRAAMEAAFRSEQTHRYPFTDIRNRDSVVRDLGTRIYVRVQPSNSVVGLVLNVFRKEFQDVRVREAIWRSIDRQRLISVVQFGDGFLAGYIPEDYTDLRLPLKEIEPYMTLDRAKARQLLSAANFPLDKEYAFPLPVEAQFYVDSGRLMGEDLAQVGIKTRLETVPRTQYIQRVGTEPGDFDFSLWPFQGSNVRQQMRIMHSKEGSFQETFSLNDPEIDTLVEKHEETLDRAEYNRIGQQIQRLLFQKYSNWIPTYSYNNYIGYYAYVRGIDFTPMVPSASGGHPYQLNMWLDKPN